MVNQSITANQKIYIDDGREKYEIEKTLLSQINYN